MSKDWPDFSDIWPGASFMGRRRFFEAGGVRLAILSLLSEGPKHGYQLMKEMEDRSSGLYRASAGSVYPTLQQLEDEELIQSDQAEGKRVYRITDAGRAELAKDPEAVKRLWERATHWGERRGFGPFYPPQPHLMAPFGAFMKSFWTAAARLATKPGGADRIREILERTSKELDQLS
jgi:DNA-binding PadR family transcriptional regulator